LLSNILMINITRPIAPNCYGLLLDRQTRTTPLSASCNAITCSYSE
jgi:hypothetical protein